MPKIVKGTIQSRARYPWPEYFDGKQRLFVLGKDYKSVKSFVSSVHQAAARLGVKAATARGKDGKEVRVQVTGKAFKKAAKRSASASPRAPKRRVSARKTPRKKAVIAPTAEANA